MKCARIYRIARNDVTGHWKYSSPRACRPGNGRRAENRLLKWLEVWTGAEEADDGGWHAAMPELPSSPEAQSIDQRSRCLFVQYGHWTYECANKRLYKARPSRTKQLQDPKVDRHDESSAEKRTGCVLSVGRSSYRHGNC